MKKSGWKIILGVAVLVCVICLGRFGWVKYQDYKTEQARKATLKEIASTEFTGENEGKEPEKVPAGVKHGQKINFKKLIKINSDIYAWIYVPGTRIDYPVAQSQESDDHYLKYNFKNEPEFAGCIYTEKANKKDFSDPNTVFYGHNMRNGSMFQNLHKFEDEAFILPGDVIYELRNLEGRMQFDIIFIDPPYHSGLEENVLQTQRSICLHTKENIHIHDLCGI